MNYQSSFKKNRSLFSLLIVGLWCLFFVASLLISQGSSYAAQVILAWDASAEAAGYKIYYGTASNNYTSVVNVANNLNHTFTDLPDGKTYYFAATAYDATNLESDYSTEVSYNASSNSSLYATFTGNGTYKYDGTSWNQITAYNPEHMVVSGSTLYGSFVNGIWKYDGSTWIQTNSTVPINMLVSGATLYTSLAGDGLWKDDGTSWNQITTYNPENMAISGSTLYGSFVNGIWKYDGSTWIQTTHYTPQLMAASGSILYGAYTNGIWKYDGTSWSQITAYKPVHMAFSGSTLYGSFAGNGIWKYDGTSWSQITIYNPANLVAGQ
jgi:hypothetical protein